MTSIGFIGAESSISLLENYLEVIWEGGRMV